MSDSFGSFDPAREDINAYLARLGQFFETKDIVQPVLAAGADNAAQAQHAAALARFNRLRRAWLIRACGPNPYQVLQDTCSPEAPETKTYEELTAILVRHYAPTRNTNSQRSAFADRKQNSSESIPDYALALRNLAKYCEFGALLDSMLQSQFINGLKDLRVKDKIIDGAANFVTLVENAAKYERDLPALPSADVHWVNRNRPKKAKNFKSSGQGAGKPFPKKPFPQQGKSHTPRPDANTTKEVRCFNCNGYGHFSRDCAKPRRPRRVHQVNEGSEDDASADLNRLDLGLVEPESTSVMAVGTPSGSFPNRIMMEVKINGKPLSMEIDTGAKASVVGKSTYQKYFAAVPLRPTKSLVWGSPMNMLGEFTAEVTVAGQTARVPLCVVDREFPSLFGFTWMRYIRLPFEKLVPTEIQFVETPPSESTEEFVSRLPKDFPLVFRKGTEPIKDFEVNLRLRENVAPIFKGPRPLAVPLREPTKATLERMCKSNFLVPCKPGPWGSPIVVVPKPHGDLRVCGDFAVTFNPFLQLTGRSLPAIDDLSIVNGVCFCILDMDQAYLQAKLSPESQEMCKINTPFGSFKFLRMPYGVSWGPGEFQEIISTILAGIENIFIYLDDVLIWGSSVNACKATLLEVLKRLESYRIRLNLRKCQFLKPVVKYLGLQLDRFGSRPDPARIRELSEMPLPKNQDDLRSWIGMITFFFRYAPNLSTLLQPLHNSVQNREWRWGKEHQDAYDRTLAALGTQILVPYSLERPLRLTTDAGPMDLGCVLAHVTADGREEPIAFGSKTLSQAERNYPVHEKEAAGVIFGLKKFFKFLYGREFEIITDNAAIAALFGEKSHVRALAAARLQRWALMLGAFRYEIRRRKSEEIPHADYLSRHPVADDTPVETEIYQVNFVEDNILVSALDLLAETDSDPVLQKVRYFVLNGWPDQVEAELQPYKKRYLQLTVEGGCLLWGTRVIVPTTLRSAVLQLLHETHPGVSRMTSLARAYVWFPGLDQEIEQLVSDCAVCQSLRPDIPHEQLVPWSWPTRRWQRIFLDFGSFRGVDMLLCIDGHSKWPEVQRMPDLTANSTIEVLRSWYSRYGLPEEVVCDNGPPFSSKAFREFVEKHGGVLTHSPTYHPQSNGQAERGVRSLKDGLEKMLLDPKTASRSLQHNVESWLFAYRNTPHSVTKVSPAELFLGRRPRTNLSLLQPDQLLKKRMQEARVQTQAAHPGKTSAYLPGSLVWVRTTIHRTVKWQPGVIVSVVSTVSYEVAVQGRVRQVSSTHLRRRSPTASSIEADPLARTGTEIDAEAFPTDHAVVPHADAVELPPPPVPVPIPSSLATPPTPPTGTPAVPMTPRPAPALPPSSPCPTAGPSTPRTPRAASTTSSLDAFGPTSPAQTATPGDTSRATPGLDPTTCAGGGNRSTTAPLPGTPMRTRSGRLIVNPKLSTCPSSPAT